MDVQEENGWEEEAEVYVHALTCSNPMSTIKIKGEARNKMTTILIDSGSTHSFLDPRAAKDTGFEMTEAVLMEVSVANGSKMFSTHWCKNFELDMQGGQCRKMEWPLIQQRLQL